MALYLIRAKLGMIPMVLDSDNLMRIGDNDFFTDPLKIDDDESIEAVCFWREYFSKDETERSHLYVPQLINMDSDMLLIFYIDLVNNGITKKVRGFGRIRLEALLKNRTN